MILNKAKSWISVFTLLTFLVSGQFVLPIHSAMAEAISSPQQFESFKIENLKTLIPSTMGNVEEFWVGKSSKVPVVVIQDAHEIPDAQKNIYQLIQLFEKKYSVTQIGLEGASAQLDPQFLRSFPNRKILTQVIAEYFQNAEITGGTAAAILSSTQSHYQGLEDWQLFQEAIQSYQQAMQFESQAANQIFNYEKEIDLQKQRVFSDKLLALDKRIHEFYEDKTGLPALLPELAAIQAPLPGSEIALILNKIKSPSQPATQKFETEIKKWIPLVRSKLAHTPALSEDLKAFNEKVQQFQTSRMTTEEFALYLKTTAAKLGRTITFSAELAQGVESQYRLQSIQGGKLFEELEQYIAEVSKVLADKPEAQALLIRSRELQVFKRFAHLEITPKDWMKIKSSEGDHFGVNRESWSHHFDFYENAEKRDQVLFNNLIKLARNSHEQQPVVMVAGGFHSLGMSERLKNAGISFALLTPRIAHVPKETKYKSHMVGDVSWKKYFESQDGRINIYEAFMRGIRDRLLSRKEQGDEPGMLLKAWRDQIVRDLAVQKRVEDSIDLTRFLDEIGNSSKTNGEARMEMLSARVKDFIQDLRYLQKINAVTSENIFKLLKPSMAPSAAVNAGVLDRGAVFLNVELTGARSELRNVLPRRGFLKRTFFALVTSGLALLGGALNVEAQNILSSGQWRILGMDDTGPSASRIKMANGNPSELKIMHGGHQIFSIKGNGFLRAVPPEVQWGTSFVLPGYWTGNDYLHNSKIKTLTPSIDKSGQLVLKGTIQDDRGNFSASDFTITLHAPAQGRVEMDLNFTLTAQKDFSLNAGRHRNHEGLKIIQFSSMNIGSEYDANQARYQNAQGRNVISSTTKRDQLIFNRPQSFGIDKVLYLENTAPVPGRFDPTTYVVLGESMKAEDFAPQGWVARSNDVNDDNVGLWVSPLTVKAEYKAGEVIGRYQFVLGATRPGPSFTYPEVAGSTKARSESRTTRRSFLKSAGIGLSFAALFGFTTQVVTAAEPSPLQVEAEKALRAMNEAQYAASLTPPKHVTWVEKKSLEDIAPLFEKMHGFSKSWETLTAQGLPMDALGVVHRSFFSEITKIIGSKVVLPQGFGLDYTRAVSMIMYRDIPAFFAQHGWAITVDVVGIETRSLGSTVAFFPDFKMPAKYYLVLDPNVLSGVEDGARIQAGKTPLVLVQPATLVKTDKGIEFETVDEKWKSGEANELGFSNGVSHFVRADLMNQAIESDLKNLEISDRNLLLSGWSLTQAIKGVGIKTGKPGEPQGIKISSYPIRDRASAAGYAAMKLLTLITRMPKGADGVIPYEPSRLTDATVREVGAHEIKHTDDAHGNFWRVVWQVSQDSAGNSSTTQSDRELAERMLEQSARLESLLKEPAVYLKSLLATAQHRASQAKSNYNDSELEILDQLVAVIKTDAKKFLGQEIQLDGLVIENPLPTPAELKSGKQQKITLDAETQILALLYRVAESPERAKALYDVLALKLNLDAKAKELAARYPALDFSKSRSELRFKAGVDLRSAFLKQKAQQLYRWVESSQSTAGYFFRGILAFIGLSILDLADDLHLFRNSPALLLTLSLFFLSSTAVLTVAQVSSPTPSNLRIPVFSEQLVAKKVRKGSFAEPIVFKTNMGAFFQNDEAWARGNAIDQYIRANWSAIYNEIMREARDNPKSYFHQALTPEKRIQPQFAMRLQAFWLIWKADPVLFKELGDRNPAILESDIPLESPYYYSLTLVRRGPLELAGPTSVWGKAGQIFSWIVAPLADVESGVQSQTLYIRKTINAVPQPGEDSFVSAERESSWARLSLERWWISFFSWGFTFISLASIGFLAKQIYRKWSEKRYLREAHDLAAQDDYVQSARQAVKPLLEALSKKQLRDFVTLIDRDAVIDIKTRDISLWPAYLRPLVPVYDALYRRGAPSVESYPDVLEVTLFNHFMQRIVLELKAANLGATSHVVAPARLADALDYEFHDGILRDGNGSPGRHSDYHVEFQSAANGPIIDLGDYHFDGPVTREAVEKIHWGERIVETLRQKLSGNLLFEALEVRVRESYDAFHVEILPATAKRSEARSGLDLEAMQGEVIVKLEGKNLQVKIGSVELKAPNLFMLTARLKEHHIPATHVKAQKEIPGKQTEAPEKVVIEFRDGEAAHRFEVTWDEAGFAQLKNGIEKFLIAYNPAAKEKKKFDPAEAGPFQSFQYFLLNTMPLDQQLVWFLRLKKILYAQKKLNQPDFNMLFAFQNMSTAIIDSIELVTFWKAIHSLASQYVAVEDEKLMVGMKPEKHPQANIPFGILFRIAYREGFIDINGHIMDPPEEAPVQTGEGTTTVVLDTKDRRRSEDRQFIPPALKTDLEMLLELVSRQNPSSVRSAQYQGILSAFSVIPHEHAIRFSMIPSEAQAQQLAQSAGESGYYLALTGSGVASGQVAVTPLIIRDDGRLFAEWSGDFTTYNHSVRFATPREVEQSKRSEHRNKNLISAELRGILSGLLDQISATSFSTLRNTVNQGFGIALGMIAREGTLNLAINRIGNSLSSEISNGETGVYIALVSGSGVQKPLFAPLVMNDGVLRASWNGKFETGDHRVRLATSEEVEQFFPEPAAEVEIEKAIPADAEAFLTTKGVHEISTRTGQRVRLTADEVRVGLRNGTINWSAVEARYGSASDRLSFNFQGRDATFQRFFAESLNGLAADDTGRTFSVLSVDHSYEHRGGDTSQLNRAEFVRLILEGLLNYDNAVNQFYLKWGLEDRIGPQLDITLSALSAVRGLPIKTTTSAPLLGVLTSDGLKPVRVEIVGKSDGYFGAKNGPTHIYAAIQIQGKDTSLEIAPFQLEEERILVARGVNIVSGNYAVRLATPKEIAQYLLGLTQSGARSEQRLNLEPKAPDYSIAVTQKPSLEAVAEFVLQVLNAEAVSTQNISEASVAIATNVDEFIDVLTQVALEQASADQAQVVHVLANSLRGHLKGDLGMVLNLDSSSKIAVEDALSRLVQTGFDQDGQLHLYVSRALSQIQVPAQVHRTSFGAKPHLSETDANEARVPALTQSPIKDARIFNVMSDNSKANQAIQNSAMLAHLMEMVIGLHLSTLVESASEINEANRRNLTQQLLARFHIQNLGPDAAEAFVISNGTVTVNISVFLQLLLTQIRAQKLSEASA